MPRQAHRHDFRILKISSHGRHFLVRTPTFQWPTYHQQNTIPPESRTQTRARHEEGVGPSITTPHPAAIPMGSVLMPGPRCQSSAQIYEAERDCDAAFLRFPRRDRIVAFSALSHLVGFLFQAAPSTSPWRRSHSLRFTDSSYILPFSQLPPRRVSAKERHSFLC